MPSSLSLGFHVENGRKGLGVHVDLEGLVMPQCLYLSIFQVNVSKTV